MEKTKVGIIGLGGIAQLVHLPILNKQANVSIEAICDVTKSRLKSVGDKYNISKRYLDYNELLALEEIEAVIIATPTNTHSEIALEALKAGKDTLVEKPMARTSEEAKRIHEAAKKYKKHLMIGMNLRYRPDAMLLKSLINSKELGDLFLIKCSWIKPQSSSSKWFIDKSISGGGVIMDLGIVILDLALWLYDFIPIKSVSVQKFHHKLKDVEDSAVGFIRLENGSVINFEVSWSLYSETNGFNLTAFGTKGSAMLNPLRAYKRIDSLSLDYSTSTTSSKTNLFRKSYENELKHFIGSVRGNNPVISSSENAMMRMKLLDAIYKSAESNKEVYI
ncbi:MAG: Gfo/Idh/MocA family oxidoreductase [Ignavibacteriaceae bacterium]|jgi:predicted dehydrogenase|nr:Gfo/Idh/MocA family oxidoreductase [Ignavibacteriaceae bacterium]